MTILLIVRRRSNDRASGALARSSGEKVVDALSDVLRAVRLTGAIFFDIQASEPWVAETPSGEAIVEAMFPGSEHLVCYHVITRGSCWACIPGEEPTRLSAGDIIVLPHGDTHVLSSTPGLRRTPDMSLYRMPADGKLPVSISMGGSQGESVHLVCGFLGCDARPYNPLLTALPRVILVSGAAGGALAAYVQFALAESKEPRMGGQCVLGRLSELMFVDVVRHYLETLPADRTGWLAGLRDPFVGRALTAFHRAPARAWTIESLAKSVGLSRSALAERFTQFVGQPLMQYMTNWRMQLAANHLLSGVESVAVIANRVGYDSEAAFSRAFKKSVGAPPSQWRKVRNETRAT
ncbi:MAG TPA: AraC family transcriptional regulator [Steroidobacteraceae bacterium]|nr:AraC family transcriptional regulator [Steroidobacteraceae bacterium]